MASTRFLQMELSPSAKNPPPIRIARNDPDYPASLGSLTTPPSALWTVGRAPGTSERLIAMVGARAATGEGCARAQDLARDLGRSGIGIVSGGAFGIDASAHLGALAAGGATYAVLGCGTDIAYPDRHARLFSEIAKNGGLLSEYPPGTKPRRGQFPARNRIIAALAEAVIVVEAAEHSGALITARLARALGRRVLAMPGSSGTNALLRRGWATAISDLDGVMRALAGQPCPPVVDDDRPQGTLATVLHAISTGAATPALLCKRLGLPLPAVLAILTEAGLDGFVRRGRGDTYEVIGRAC